MPNSPPLLEIRRARDNRIDRIDEVDHKHLDELLYIYIYNFFFSCVCFLGDFLNLLFEEIFLFLSIMVQIIIQPPFGMIFLERFSNHLKQIQDYRAILILTSYIPGSLEAMK